MLTSHLIESVAAVPAAASAMEVVAAALDAVARASDERPGFAEFARRRHALLQMHAELRERDLTKLASLGSAMADALRRRGLSAPTASLAAEVGLAVFKVAFERCMSVTESERAKLGAITHVDGTACIQTVHRDTRHQRALLAAHPRVGSGDGRPPCC